MRRRNEVAPQETKPAETRAAEPAAPAGAYDWTTQDSPPKKAAVELSKTAAAVELGGPAAQPVASGMLFTLTMGKTTLFPVKFEGFEVGPISATVTVKEGETYGDVWQRARAALEQLYEAEFDLRLREFQEHAVKARSAVAK